MVNIKLIPGIKVSVNSSKRDLHNQFGKVLERWHLGNGWGVSFSEYALVEAARGVERNPNNKLLKAYIMAAFDIIGGDISFAYPLYIEVDEFLKLSKPKFKEAWKNFRLISEVADDCLCNQNRYFTVDGWEIEER